jgi:hypothetical protein
MGPCLVVSQGNSGHSKQSLTPLVYAQLHIWQNLFSRATQPTSPLGHVPFCILGHFSHAIPQTPTFTCNQPVFRKSGFFLLKGCGFENMRVLKFVCAPLFFYSYCGRNPVYTTTTNGLYCTMHLVLCVWFGLQVGCSVLRKQFSFRLNRTTYLRAPTPSLI